MLAIDVVEFTNSRHITLSTLGGAPMSYIQFDPYAGLLISGIRKICPLMIFL